MIELGTAANIAAMISALVDLSVAGKTVKKALTRRKIDLGLPEGTNVFQARERTGIATFNNALERHKNDPGLPDRARKLQAALSTFSSQEVRAIERRIAGCKKRFAAEGGGPQRRVCLCSVLRDVRAGNNGLEDFPEWQAAYDQLRCG